jgi:hypothetical protein
MQAIQTVVDQHHTLDYFVFPGLKSLGESSNQGARISATYTNVNHELIGYRQTWVTRVFGLPDEANSRKSLF